LAGWQRNRKAAQKAIFSLIAGLVVEEKRGVDKRSLVNCQMPMTVRI